MALMYCRICERNEDAHDFVWHRKWSCCHTCRSRLLAEILTARPIVERA